MADNKSADPLSTPTRVSAGSGNTAIQTGLEETLESISDALFAVDHHWRFIYLNQQAEALAGRPRSELLGQNAWSVFPHLANSSFYRQCQRAMRDRVPFQATRPYLHRGRLAGSARLPG